MYVSCQELDNFSMLSVSQHHGTSTSDEMKFDCPAQDSKTPQQMASVAHKAECKQLGGQHDISSRQAGAKVQISGTPPLATTHHQIRAGFIHNTTVSHQPLAAISPSMPASQYQD